MSQQGVSSLLIERDDHVCGIVTDRDLRNRVLAQGRDPAEPVASIMTPIRSRSTRPARCWRASSRWSVAASITCR